MVGRKIGPGGSLLEREPGAGASRGEMGSEVLCMTERQKDRDR